MNNEYHNYSIIIEVLLGVDFLVIFSSDQWLF